MRVFGISLMKGALLSVVVMLFSYNVFASDDMRAKARYYFMQGSIEASVGNMPQAYEYFKKAFELDPGYGDASFTYGSQRLFIQTDTMQSDSEMKRSLRLMQDYVDSNPSDLYATQMYGYLTSALDTLEESVRVYETTYSLMPSETQLLPQLSDAYMRLGKNKDALGALQRYENIEGKSKDISLKKITFLLASKDTLSAVREVNELIDYNPRDPMSHILKGNLYEVVGDRDSVLKAYKEAEVLAPSNGAVKMSLAQYYREIGDSVMLDNMMYEALLSEEFELEDKLGILGDYLQKLLDESGDRQRGDHLFAVLQAQYPHEPAVLDMAARYAGAKGDYAGAAESIGYAIDMDPVNEKYWLMLLSYEMTRNQYSQAVKDYQRAKEHIEPSLQLKNLYTAAATMLPDSLETERILKEMLRETDERLVADNLDKKDLEKIRSSSDYDGLVWISNLYCMLGDLYYKQGKADEGFQEYENSLYFLSDNALTLNNFAYFLSEEDRDLEKARQMSRRSLDLVENNATYLDTFAWILYKMGEYQEAMDYMKLALELAAEAGDDNEEYKVHYEAIEKALESVTGSSQKVTD